MVTVVKFIVPAVPVAQPRQRNRVIKKKGKAFAHNYTPTDSPVNSFKAAVKMAAAQAYQGPPLAGPLYASFLFVMPRPPSMVWKKRQMPRQYDPRRPDRDNLMKSLQDALDGLLFGDDSQIVSGPVEKFIASGDEQPHVEVEIRTIDGDQCPPNPTP